MYIYDREKTVNLPVYHQRSDCNAGSIGNKCVALLPAGLLDKNLKESVYPQIDDIKKQKSFLLFPIDIIVIFYLKKKWK